MPDYLELQLPSHWNCALYYGDDSGLEDEDQVKIDKVREHITKLEYSNTPIGHDEDLGFLPTGSFDMKMICQCKLAGDFTTFIFPMFD